jgi:ribonuclease HII
MLDQPLIAGVDEVGRGPLAGPVVAAAVIFHPGQVIVGVADSKKLTAKKRDALYEIITRDCLCYAVGHAEVAEIDQINILQASLLAMQRAVLQLTVKPDKVLVDGNRCPALSCAAEAIVGGDNSVAEISAASIIAKVLRDREMDTYEQQFPGYGFAEHKGYATAKHLAAIRRLGITPIHRKSFEPIRQLSLFAVTED